MTCIACGLDFHARPSLVSKGKKYCSMRCYDDARASRVLARVSSGDKRCSRCSETKPLGEFYTHGRRVADGRSSWCKSCRCANERERRLDPVVSGRFRGRYEGDMRFRARELVRAMGKRCKAGGLPFDLDVEWLSARLESGRCELTGLEFDMTVSRKRGGPFSPSVDRILPSGGYTKQNCRVVLFAVNAALSDWGLNVFLPIADALVTQARKEPAA